MRTEITTKSISYLNGRITDTKIRGFIARRLRSGKVQFGFAYGSGQARRWITIGLLGEINVAEARRRAEKYAGQVSDHRDPAAELKSKISTSIESRFIEKFSRFAALKLNPACYLYRQYGIDGDLLYVGISLEPLRRQNRHMNFANWRSNIFRILVEPFETREEALEAERVAIRQEFPKFNNVHNGRRSTIEEIAAVIAKK